MIYIIAFILYLAVFLFDRNTTFVTKYPYSTPDKDKRKSLFPKKVWFVTLSIITFFIPIFNIFFPVATFIIQLVCLTFDYEVVLKEGKFKSFIDFLNKDLYD